MIELQEKMDVYLSTKKARQSKPIIGSRLVPKFSPQEKYIPSNPDPFYKSSCKPQEYIEPIDDEPQQGVKPDLDNTHCKECDGTNFIIDPTTGDEICKDCGLIRDDHCVDEGKDWRSFSMDQEKNRARTSSLNIMQYDYGLSTKISKDLRDYRGSAIDSKSAQKHDHLRKVQMQYGTSGRKDSNFSEAMDELKVYSQMFHLNKPIRDDVSYYYRRVVKSQKLKGRVIKNLILAVIYIVCRMKKEPLTIREITEKGKITEKEFNKFRSKVLRVLQIKLSPVTPYDFLNRINGTLQIKNNEVMSFAQDLLNRIQSLSKHSLEGKDPAGVAGGAFYLSCFLSKYDYTQQQIGETINVTDVTIRTRYKEMVKKIFEPSNPKNSVIDTLHKIVNTDKSSIRS